MDGVVYSYHEDQLRSTEGMSIKDINYDIVAVDLDVMDRVCLSSVFRTKITGTYSEMSIIKKLEKDITFTPEEHKKLNFRQVEIDGEQSFLWDDNDIPKKTVSFTYPEKAAVAAMLEGLNESKQLTRMNYSIYERFCIEGV